MIRETIAPVLEQVGILPPAIEDAVARAERCFGSGEPTEAELLSWAEQLRSEAPHLFGTPRGHAQGPSSHTEIPDWLPAAERLARARHMSQTVVHDKGSRRPQPYTPTPEQLRSIEGKSPVERINAYRQWQREAQQ